MKKTLMIIFACLTTCFTHKAQRISPVLPCYAVAGNSESSNVLFKYDPEGQVWDQIGITGASYIEAIAIDHDTGTIYATDGGVFGLINPINGEFKPINAVGTGIGEFGAIALNDVNGLTYDPINEVMYGTHHIPASGLGTNHNDLLFQIEKSTGRIIINSMQDSNGNAVDYAIVPEVYFGEWIGDGYDVNDIAYNIYTGDLFAIHSAGESCLISQLNSITGELEYVIYDLPFYNVGGLTFSNISELYATIGDDNGLDSGSFINMDLNGGFTYNIGKIDQTEFGFVDFNACDCQFIRNDLALRLTIGSSPPFSIDDQVTFLITIFNQGTISNQDIVISNYFDSGLILNDNGWTDLGNSTATTTIPGPLAAGASISIPITFTLDLNSCANENVNYAEITSSINPDFSNSTFFGLGATGNLAHLPDIDSSPDNQNNEVLIMDNEIYGKGSKADEDEDDHDSETIYIIIDGCTYVYPGDLNYDGIVNNQDRSISYNHIGENGPSRDPGGIDWKSQTCADWNKLQKNGHNIKHHDCDGNGNINSNDANAINVNYGKTHTLLSGMSIPQIPIYSNTDFQIVLQPINQISLNNNNLIMHIIMDSKSGQNLEVFGGHFSIDYSNIIGNVDTAFMAFENFSWLGIPNVNLLADSWHNAEEHTIEVGFTKTDRQASIGKGIIGQAIFKLNTSNMRLNNNCENLLDVAITKIGAFNAQQDTLKIENECRIVNLSAPCCEPFINLNEDTPFQNLYTSSGTIMTDGYLPIDSNQQVIYQAEEVILNEGFSVKAGASFEISVGNGCN